MGKYRALFVWWLITLAVASVCYWLNTKNVPMLIYTVDITHITQVILAVILIANFWLGYVAWSVARGTWDSLRAIKHTQGLWFYSNQMFLWGILGTVSGSMFLFYNSFGSIAKIANADFSTMITNVLPPLGIIFSTTALGIAGAIILSNQLFWFTSLSGIEDE